MADQKNIETNRRGKVKEKSEPKDQVIEKSSDEKLGQNLDQSKKDYADHPKLAKFKSQGSE